MQAARMLVPSPATQPQPWESAVAAARKQCGYKLDSSYAQLSAAAVRVALQQCDADADVWTMKKVLGTVFKKAEEASLMTFGTARREGMKLIADADAVALLKSVPIEDSPDPDEVARRHRDDEEQSWAAAVDLAEDAGVEGVQRALARQGVVAKNPVTVLWAVRALQWLVKQSNGSEALDRYRQAHVLASQIFHARTYTPRESTAPVPTAGLVTRLTPH